MIINIKELEAVSLAMSKDSTRYYMHGVCIESNGGMIATDGHRMHSIGADMAGTREGAFVLKSDDVKKIIAIAKATKQDTCDIINWEGRITCGAFTFKAVDGNFPDWRRIVPSITKTQPTTCISFNGAFMADFHKAIKMITDNRRPHLILQFTDAYSPILITCRDERFTGVLMSVRV